MALNPHYLPGEGIAAAHSLHKLPHPSQVLSIAGCGRGWGMLQVVLT